MIYSREELAWRAVETFACHGERWYAALYDAIVKWEGPLTDRVRMERAQYDAMTDEERNALGPWPGERAAATRSRSGSACQPSHVTTLWPYTF